MPRCQGSSTGDSRDCDRLRRRVRAQPPKKALPRKRGGQPPGGLGKHGRAVTMCCPGMPTSDGPAREPRAEAQDPEEAALLMLSPGEGEPIMDGGWGMSFRHQTRG